MPVGTIIPAVADVLHSTLTKSRRKLVLASIKSNALMAWVFANDRVEYEDGGYNITNPLTVGRNPNITSYSYYSPLPVNQTDEFDTVEYGYSRVAGTVIISDQEQDENNGAAAIFKLMKEKMNVTIPLTEGKAGKRMFDLGFEGVLHNNVPMMYDEDCPVNYAYFINDTYLRLHMLRGVNMKVKELVSPWNVDAVGSRVVWQGQWCLWKAFRTHAVLTN
jgi:hypothetical protein